MNSIYLSCGSNLGERRRNIEAALAELKAAGYRLIDEEPQTGAGGYRVAFVHPKSAGGVLLEFQAEGLACIASDTGGMSELVDGGTNALGVPPGDVDALGLPTTEETRS